MHHFKQSNYGSGSIAKKAVLCHFDEGKAPERIRLHFITDPVLATA